MTQTSLRPATDFATMTNSELVSTHNEMVLTATDLGLTDPFVRTVNRFSDQKAGVARCTKLHSAIQARLAGMQAEERREAKEPAAEVPAVADTSISAGIATALTSEELDEVENLPETTPPATPAEDNAAPAAQTGEAPSAEPTNEGDDDMAKKAKAAKAKTPKAAAARKAPPPRTKSTDGSTIREMTEEYNALVPAAKKAGVAWAKHHTSNFESKDKAGVALKKLRDAMKKAG